MKKKLYFRKAMAAVFASVMIAVGVTPALATPVQAAQNSIVVSNERDVLVAGRTYYVENDNATNFKSSNEAVATVDKDGKITPKKTGYTTISATVDGKKVKTKFMCVSKYGVTASQAKVDKMLQAENVKNISIVTTKDADYQIAEGDYAKKVLTVKAPNADVDNYGTFKKIKVKDVGENTFRNYKTNKVVITDKNFHFEEYAQGSEITIAEEAKGRLVVQGQDTTIITGGDVEIQPLGKNATIAKVEVTGGKLTLTGAAGGSKIDVADGVAAEIKVDASVDGTVTVGDTEVKPGDTAVVTEDGNVKVKEDAATDNNYNTIIPPFIPDYGGGDAGSDDGGDAGSDAGGDSVVTYPTIELSYTNMLVATTGASIDITSDYTTGVVSGASVTFVDKYTYNIETPASLEDASIILRMYFEASGDQGDNITYKVDGVECSPNMEVEVIKKLSELAEGENAIVIQQYVNETEKTDNFITIVINKETLSEETPEETPDEMPEETSKFPNIIDQTNNGTSDTLFTSEQEATQYFLEMVFDNRTAFGILAEDLSMLHTVEEYMALCPALLNLELDCVTQYYNGYYITFKNAKLYAIDAKLIYAVLTEDTSFLSTEEKSAYDKLFTVTKELALAEKSNIDKVVAIHDYLVLNTAYDQGTASEAGDESSKYAEGVFNNNKAVASGYASAFRLLLMMQDIPCEYVWSDSENHGWNLVQLDGKWYHVDVTWDDPTPDEAGRVLYSYFMMTDEEVAGLASHESWKCECGNAASHNCTDTTYRIYPYQEYVCTTEEAAAALIEQQKGTNEITLVYPNSVLTEDRLKTLAEEKLGSEVTYSTYSYQLGSSHNLLIIKVNQ